MSLLIRGLAAALALVLLTLAVARGDEFERVDGERIAGLLRDPKTRTRQALGFRELEALPAALGDSRSAFLLATTDQGNLAKLLVAPAFRKRMPPAAGKDDLVPVVLVERLEVYDGAHPASRMSRGRDLVLFPGFQLDLDSGQVVPEGFGGDLRFSSSGPDDGRLQPIGPARLATLEQSLKGPSPGAIVDGRAPVPHNLAGRFRLVADGRWSGWLTLGIEPGGAVSGRFQSEASGSDYPVSGKIDPQVPRKLRFTIQFPRARQEYEGILFSEGNQAICGLGTMLDRSFGFVALREGSAFEPDAGGSAEIRPDAEGRKRGTAWTRVRIDPASDRYLVDREARAGDELPDLFATTLRAKPQTGLIVMAADTVSYARLRTLLDAAKKAGIATIRLVAEDDEP